jgi:colanic acid/amylovoran biosynthesis glycosyltransferase
MILAPKRNRGGRRSAALKVAMVVWEFPSVSETFVLNQAAGLIDRGHTIHIYAHSPRQAPLVHRRVDDYDLQARAYFASAVPNDRLGLWLAGMSALAAHALRNPTLLPRALTAGRQVREDLSWTQICEARPLLRHGPYNVIHYQFGISGLRYAGLHRLGLLTGRSVTSFRGYDLSLYLRQFGDQVYHPLFKVGALFLPNSEHLKRRLIDVGCPEEKILVHPSGVDCKRFPFAPRRISHDDRIRIVTVGRCVEKKGIEYAIRAVASLLGQFPGIEYLIVGDGPLQGSLQAMIRALGAEATIRLLGWKREDAVADILRSSHILLAPSVTGVDGDQESIPNALKEAMATGLPVVSTRHAGIPELVEDGVSGFLVPERDVDALASKLHFLIEHPEVWRAMGHAGRARVEKRHNIETLNDRLVDIYRTVSSAN